MSELQRFIRANGIMLFFLSATISIPAHHVLGLYHFPLSIRFLFWWGRVEGVVGIHPTRQNLPNGYGLVSSSYFIYFKLHFMFS